MIVEHDGQPQSRNRCQGAPLGIIAEDEHGFEQAEGYYRKALRGAHAVWEGGM